VLVAQVDALASSPFPPTPVPGAAVIVEEAVEPPAQPTQVVVPPTWTPPAQVSGAPTLAEVERVMPTAEELGLSAEGYILNTDLSFAGTAQDWVALWEGLGLTNVANALDQNAAQNGLIGQVARVWDTGGTCPPGMAISLEIDVSVFETPAGAGAFLTDPTYLQALGSLGVIAEQSGGALITSLSTPTDCGPMMTYAKTIVSGQFLVASSVIVYQDTDRAEVLPVLDLVNSFMVDKLAQTGF
jgi:hypothetical protein